jgi:hypothetical protein
MSHRLSPLALCLALSAAPAAAQAPLTEAAIRDLAARQTAAFNAGDLAGYFATFAPKAVFTAQALGSDNRITPYGSSTVAQARAQLSKTVSRSKVSETVEVRRVALARSGRGGALSARVRTRIETAGQARLSCAERLTTFAEVGGSLRALSQTDTLVRCRTAP